MIPTLILSWYATAPAALQVLLKATMLLGVACGVDVALRQRHPALRVGMWRAMLVALVALPLLHALPALISMESGRREASPALYAPAVQRESHTPAPPAVEVLPAAPVDHAPQRIRAAGNINTAPETVSPHDNFPTTLALLLAVYAGGLLCGLAALLRAQRVVKALLAETLPACEATLDAAAQLARRLELNRPVGVRIHPQLCSPLVSGMRRVCVVLPGGISHAGERQAALAHELSHVRSADLPWNFAMTLARVLAWAHPLVWVMERRHRAAMEEAADLQAAALLGDREEYARRLAQVALRLTGRVAPQAAIAMARSAEITHRLRRLRVAPLGPNRPVLARSVVGVLALGMLGVANAEVKPAAAVPKAPSIRVVKPPAPALPAAPSAGGPPRALPASAPMVEVIVVRGEDAETTRVLEELRAHLAQVGEEVDREVRQTLERDLKAVHVLPDQAVIVMQPEERAALEAKLRELPTVITREVNEELERELHRNGVRVTPHTTVVTIPGTGLENPRAAFHEERRQAYEKRARELEERMKSVAASAKTGRQTAAGPSPEEQEAAEEAESLSIAQLLERVRDPQPETSPASMTAFWNALAEKLPQASEEDQRAAQDALAGALSDPRQNPFLERICQIISEQKTGTNEQLIHPLNEVMLYGPSSAARSAAARALGTFHPRRDVIKMLRDALATEWDEPVKRSLRDALDGKFAAQ